MRMVTVVAVAGAILAQSFAVQISMAAGVGATCGGLAGVSCDAGLWCENSPGTCGGKDLQGKCAKVPEVCTEQFLPVCGCDGKTYGNDCQRASARAQKAHDGKC